MNRIRELRKKTGLSVCELAKKAHVNMMSIYRYERGERIPKVATAYAIAAALGCTIDELYEREGECDGV